MHRLIVPAVAVVAAAVALLFMFIARPRSLATVEMSLASAPGLAADASGVGDDRLIAAREARVAPALAEGTWINSDRLELADLRGRVVLVDFWTYGCYNCRNTLPALKRLDKAYRERGLTIVGVHSPEFDHEKSVDNVRRQVRSLGIRYPVVTDNDYVTWRAYGIQAWPTVVILDKRGRIRWTHIGEGMYAEQEDVIKKLLAEESEGERQGPAKAETDSNEDRNVVSSKSQASDSGAGKGRSMTQKVTRTDEEWRQILTPEQFYVTRQKGTERAFTGEYYASKEKGVYLCVACGNELFRSDTKYDSGTGWPSFWAPAAEENVKLEEDQSHGMRRTEVMCSRCGAHLGHVFDDGPEPTNLRYCINSVALRFKKQ